MIWAVEGLRRLRSRGKFDIPQSSTAALAQYRTESDPVALFFEECLEATEHGGLKTSALYAGFEVWRRINGYSAINIITFGKRLGAQGCGRYESGGKTTWKLKVKSDAHKDVEWAIGAPHAEDPMGIGRTLAELTQPKYTI